MLGLPGLLLLVLLVEHLVARDLTVHVRVVALHIRQFLVQDESLGLYYGLSVLL